MTGAPRYRAAPMSWVDHDGQLLALSKTSPAWALVNTTARSISEFCANPDGRSLDEVRSWFEGRFGPVESTELQGWLGALADGGLLATEAPRPAEARPSRAYSVEHMYLELLARCNLRCLHCFMGGAPERTEAFELDQALALIDTHAGQGGRYVTLSGGEPLIYRDIGTVIDHVAERGLYGTLITNGVRLTEDDLDRLDHAGFNLAVSLDGIDPEVNNRIRGKGAENAKASLLRGLERLGPDRIVLSFTPVKANMGELDALFAFIEEHGIRRLNLSIYEAVGRAEEHTDLLSLDAEDRLRLVHAVYGNAVKLAGRVEIDLNDTRSVLNRFNRDAGSEDLHPLWRGVRVTSSGDVYPASFGAVEKFHLGNVFERPFEDILNSPVLTDLYETLTGRVQKTPKCSVCDWSQICRGGSVAAAFCATGNMFSPDPYCDAYLEVFPKVLVALTNRYAPSAEPVAEPV
ncbi:MAG: radical SAM protein [Rhodobacter sp.]|nr:radical SAM protein [Rhodobacter sp.]